MRAFTFLAIVFFVLLSITAHSAEFMVSVEGGENELRDVPVRVAVKASDVSSRTVYLTGDGIVTFGQLTKPSILSNAQGEDDWELHFVLPNVEANSTIKLIGKTIHEQTRSFSTKDEAGLHQELSFDGRPVMRYMYEKLDNSTPERLGETYKVFHHVYDPSGSRYVTKGPGGLFPHHRGLFFGFNKISYGNQQADIWHCRDGEHQSHDGFVAEELGPVVGRQQLAIGWHGRDGKIFANEVREMTSYNVPGGVMIEFASVLKSVVGKVRLAGDPQHAGFQFRAAQDVPDKTKHLTYYVRPDGKDEPGQFRNWSDKADESEINKNHISLAWNALSFVLDDQRYTCCYLDHPNNPKPARYSERDYGRFGSYFEYDLDTDKPLRLNYRIWLQEGELTVEQVQERSAAFVSAPRTEATNVAEVASVQGAKKKVIFVAGTRSHGYGAHEHYAGCRLLAKHLEDVMPNFETEVYRDGWPSEGMSAFEGADAVVVYCDGGGRHLLNPHIKEFNALMEKGVGLACVHYGVEVPKGESGNAFLDWIGGYFEMNWSVNPHWTAKFEAFPDHPVSNGVKPFEINDEWYFHMRFRDGMQGVTPILSAVAPADTMNRSDGPHSGNPAVRKSVATGERQHMAWAYERPGGGRGFGFTGGHDHWNWGNDNFRKVVLNAIVWIANGDVPDAGVSTSTPSRDDLEADQDYPKPTAKPQEEKKAAKASAPKVTTIPTALTTDGEQDDSHDADKAVANLDVHPELKASLFAAEPLLLSPSNIDVDHKGRVWVCEIVNYRAHRDKRSEGDRILILEDTDGDGIADSQKVFYQGRDIDSPHGICVLGDRVIVSAKGKVISFRDSDGDDIPDEREDMYTGIDGAQHDHGIHAFIFGPDGKFYFNFGNEGKQLLDAEGNPIVDVAGNVVNNQRNPYQEGMVFRVNTDGTDLETLGWNFRNNWMVTVDSFGTIWQSDNDDDGNRGVRINFVMEFGNYGYKDEFTGAGWRDARTGMSELPQKHWHLNDPGVVPNLLHTGAGSPTGITVYEGNLMPVSLRGQLLHCDAGPSVTRAYIVSSDGAGYKAEISNILEGTRDQWFRPSDVKVAPDGSLIVADWYDPGVGGHNMGDLDRGRIFRVVPKNHDGAYEIPEFDFSTAAGAVEALRNPNYSVRYLAWTALHEMGAKAETELLKLWSDPNPRMRARALWLLGKIAGRGQQYVDAASRDAEADIRIVALRLARQLPSVDHINVVKRLAKDPSAAVRRECAIALRHNKTNEAAELWAQLAWQHDGKDRWYLEALGIAADKQWDRFMSDWLKGTKDLHTPAARDIIWRSRASKSPQWLEEIIQSDVGADQLARYFRALDFADEAGQQKVVADLAFGKQTGTDDRKRMIAVESLRRLHPDTVTENPDFYASVKDTLKKLDGTTDFVDLVGRFSVHERYPDLLRISQQDAAGQTGIEAMRTLLSKGGQDIIRSALRGNDDDAVVQTILALGNSSDNRAVGVLQELIQGEDRDLEQRRHAVRAMARIRRGAMLLIRSVRADELDVALRPSAAAELTRSSYGDIRTEAEELFPLPPSKSAEKLPPISELAEMQGSAERGAAVFQNAGTCAKCHIVGGQGKEVGPNLSEIGSKLSREAMFESILYPSAGISHNYEAYMLVTEDGNAVNGLLTSQSESAVTITAEDGIARTFQRSEIEELQKQKVSLMPSDLQKLMTKEELVDVIEYMTTLKKK